jgi:hypothetical protein
MSSDQRKLEISWVQVSAGALAAVSSAVLLSTVGVAGTIIGAALGSLAATVGSTVYSHYLAVSRDRVAAAAAARSRVRHAQGDVGEAVADLAHGAPAAERRLDEAEHHLQHAEIRLDDAEEATGRPGWRAALAGLPWGRLLLAAGALFLVAMVAIVSFELVTGRALSSYTGGSDRNGPRVSVPGVDGEGKKRPEPTPTPAPSPSETPPSTSAAPTPTPTRGGTGTTTPPPTPAPSSTSTLPSEIVSPSPAPSG